MARFPNRTITARAKVTRLFEETFYLFGIWKITEYWMFTRILDEDYRILQQQAAEAGCRAYSQSGTAYFGFGKKLRNKYAEGDEIIHTFRIITKKGKTHMKEVNDFINHKPPTK